MCLPVFLILWNGRLSYIKLYISIYFHHMIEYRLSVVVVFFFAVTVLKLYTTFYIICTACVSLDIIYDCMSWVDFTELLFFSIFKI